MRRYAASELRAERRNRITFSLPDDIFQLSGLAKFSKLGISLTRVPDDGKAPLLERNETFCISLIPFPKEVLSKMFYIEVQISSRPSTLASVLSLLKKSKVNILDCNSIDTFQGGIAELVVALNVGDTTERSRLKRKLRKIVQDVKVLKPIDEMIAASSLDQELYFFKRSEIIQFNGVGWSFAMPDSSRLGSSAIHSEIAGLQAGAYVSLVFDNRTKILQAFFRDPEEIVVWIEATFILERRGQLERVASPLSNLAVDLRLIHAKILLDESQEGKGGEGKVTYEIIGNIQHTKLQLFDRDTLEEVLRSEISASMTREDGPSPENVKLTRVSPGREQGDSLFRVTDFSFSLVQKGPSAGISDDIEKQKYFIFHEVDDADQWCSIGMLHEINSGEWGLFRFRVKMPRSLPLEEEHLLSLIEGALVLSRSKLEQVPEDLKITLQALFLVNFSDLLHAAMLTSSCLKLCNLIGKLKEAGRDRVFGDCRRSFQDVKYGLINFIKTRKFILVRAPSRFIERNFSDDDLVGVLDKFGTFIESLEEAAHAVYSKKTVNNLADISSKCKLVESLLTSI